MVERWSQTAGRAGLYLLAGSAFLAPAGTVLASAILFIAFLFAAPVNPPRRDDPLLAITLVCLAYLAFSSAIHAVVHPDRIPTIIAAAVDWAMLSLFVPVAYFIGSDHQRLGRLVMLIGAGLLAGMLLRLDWPLLLHSPLAYIDSREGFGFPVNAFALYVGVAMLALVFLAERWRGMSSRSHLMLISSATWLACTAIFTQAFVSTQSRGAWIAFAAAMVPAIAMLIWGAHAYEPGSRSAHLRTAVVGVIIAVLVFNGFLLTDRVTAELDTVAAIIDGESVATNSSVSVRWHALQFGLDHWIERPWFGWGAGMSEPLLSASGDPNLVVAGQGILRHLHNSYLEILVQFGVVGLMLACIFVLLLIYRMWVGYRSGTLPWDYSGLLASALVFTLFWALFSYRAVHQDWRVYWILLVGAIASPLLTRRIGGEVE